MTREKFYITTPLYYVNGELHIGGAYTTLAADILARWHRAHGKDVFFLTGSDEHGQKIEREAAEHGMAPKEFADSIVQKFHELWEALDITFDHFIRTTDDYHERAVGEVFKKLMDSGDIYLGRYEGLYCTPCETFVTSSEDGLCPSCGRELERISEENYFFRLSKYGDALLELIDGNPSFILPPYRRAEVRNRVAEGLEDISVSRSTFKWGVPVPGDPDHIVYVWFDALLNYVTALGAPDDTERFRRYWPADLHLIGKDIIWFHCVIWPAMLMALGYEPPRTVFAHGWWTINGEKISKSKGNIVYPREVVSLYGADTLRFFLFREVPFGRDGNFTFEAVDNRYHQELANGLGNLVMRTASMITRYFGGKLPSPAAEDEGAEALAALASAMPARVREAMERVELGAALEHIWNVVREANRFVENSKPWVLAKEGETERLGTVLYTLAETSRLLLVELYPFLPRTAPAGLAQLGAEWDPLDAEPLERWGVLKPGSPVTKGKPLFPRVERPGV